MSFSASKNKSNYDIVNEGQTLYDFLKRKKKFNLQSTISKNVFQSNTKRKYEAKEQEEKTNNNSNIQKYSQLQYFSNRQKNKNQKANITPKKIEFDDKRQSKRFHQTVTSNKNFLSLISPLKKRNEVGLEQQEDKQNGNKSNKKANSVINYTRKNLNKSINNLKQIVTKLLQNTQVIKQKSHNLTVFFNPLFNFASEQSHHPISKNVGDLKNKLRSLQTYVDGLNGDSYDKQMDAIYQNIQEYLQQEQGHFKKQHQRIKFQEISDIKQQKNDIIERLQIEKRKLQYEVSSLQKKLSKMENNQANIEEGITDREINYVEQIDSLKLKYQSQRQLFQQKIQELSKKNQQLIQRERILEKEVKNIKKLIDQSQRKNGEQIRQITEAKDSYLLQQILILKSEFNADIVKINELHKIKQKELLQKIERQEIQLNKSMFERGCDKQIEGKILQQANQVKQQSMHLKHKMQCIANDMFRMNQQLFQHWMALKDIKLLTSRLGNYGQIKQIYDDLMFNDQLFR